MAAALPENGEVDPMQNLMICTLVLQKHSVQSKIKW